MLVLWEDLKKHWKAVLIGAAIIFIASYVLGACTGSAIQKVIDKNKTESAEEK